MIVPSAPGIASGIEPGERDQLADAGDQGDYEHRPRDHADQAAELRAVALEPQPPRLGCAVDRRQGCGAAVGQEVDLPHPE
jgi:hypothetical protein